MAVQNPQGGGGSANAVVNNPALAATNTIQPTADIVPLTVKGMAGQTADLFSVITSGSISRFRVDINGNVHAGSNLFVDGGGSLFVVGGQVIAQQGAATAVATGSVGPGSASGITFQNGETGSNLYRSAAGILSSDAGWRLQPATDIVLLTLKPKAAGAANVLEMYNAAGTLTAKWLPAGTFTNPANTTSIDFNGGFIVAGAYVQSLGPIYVDGGALNVRTAGSGITVREGANCKQGASTLVAGTVVVANSSVTATSRIFLTGQDNNVTGAVRVSARTAGTSFTILSTVLTDTGVVAWEIFESN